MRWFLAYVASIVLANLAITAIGIMPVGFGLMAPAGVYFAGLAFWFRDQVQDEFGKLQALTAIGVGAAGSAVLTSSDLALASAAAFLFSELCDMAVYTPLARRQWIAAVVASNVVGSVVDSALFLWLAFGSLDFLAGNTVGKWEATLAILPVLWWMRRRRAVSVSLVW